MLVRYPDTAYEAQGNVLSLLETKDFPLNGVEGHNLGR
jgi:hypothetical protein